MPGGYVLQSARVAVSSIAGSIMVGVPYFIGLSFGGDLEDEDAWLYVPVLGPWFTLAGRIFPATTSPSPSTARLTPRFAPFSFWTVSRRAQVR